MLGKKKRLHCYNVVGVRDIQIIALCPLLMMIVCIVVLAEKFVQNE